MKVEQQANDGIAGILTTIEDQGQGNYEVMALKI